MAFYYKSDLHEEQTNLLLKKFGKIRILDDVAYGVFAYIVGATYKANQIVKIIDEEGYIDVDKLYEMIGVYSNSEQGMIRFALQLFNSGIDDIKLTHVMQPLDPDNTKVIKQAIDIRF